MGLCSFISTFSFSGIKNIAKPITLDFYKKTLEKKFTPDNYNIKSIYGPNGVGKTAIIDAMTILKAVILDAKSLVTKESLLRELLNKKSDTMSFSVPFITYDEQTAIIVDKSHYELEILFTNTDIIISKERLSVQKHDKVIYETTDGKFSTINDRFITMYNDEYINLTTHATVAALTQNMLLNNEEMNNANDNPMELMCLLLFAHRITVISEIKDNHNQYWFVKKIDEINSIKEKVNIKIPLSVAIDQIPNNKKALSEYQNNIRHLTRFLKIIKPNLKEIECVHKEDGEYIHIDQYMVYDDYKVHVEFESTGIKKYIELFDAFKRLEKGAIVFIDELDAHLHDVFLNALIEYFFEFPKGQLVFTTHNLSPMETLKHKRKSIDFLTHNHGIVPWHRKGNTSILKMYRSGMIEGLPFNVDYTDYIGMFDCGEVE